MSHTTGSVKIGLVSFRGDPGRGGAERYTADLAAALKNREHQVDLIAAQFGPEIPGVQFMPLNARAATRSGQYSAFLNSLDKHLQNHQYDIVHAMLPIRRCDVYHLHAGLAKETMNKLHSRINLKRRLYARTEARLLTGPEFPIVLCFSDGAKAPILRQYPNLGNQLVSLFNAVDLAVFDPERYPNARKSIRTKFDIPSDAVIALMIAQDFARKGLARAIAALPHTAANLRLLVVGRQKTSAYARQARRIGVSSRVIFAGPTDSPAEFYNAADFFVLPTHHDPCSLVVLESLAMGLPTVSTSCNGACEIMTDGKHGYVLDDPNDIPSLANAMSRLADADLRKHMQESCLELRPRLSFETHVDRLLEIYAMRKQST